MYFLLRRCPWNISSNKVMGTPLPGLMVPRNSYGGRDISAGPDSKKAFYPLALRISFPCLKSSSHQTGRKGGGQKKALKVKGFLFVVFPLHLQGSKHQSCPPISGSVGLGKAGLGSWPGIPFTQVASRLIPQQPLQLSLFTEKSCSE